MWGELECGRDDADDGDDDDGDDDDGDGVPPGV